MSELEILNEKIEKRAKALAINDIREFYNKLTNIFSELLGEPVDMNYISWALGDKEPVHDKSMAIRKMMECMERQRNPMHVELFPPEIWQKHCYKMTEKILGMIDPIDEMIEGERY